MTKGTNSQIIRSADYSAFIKDVKQRIQSAQIKAEVDWIEESADA